MPLVASTSPHRRAIERVYAKLPARGKGHQVDVREVNEAEWRALCQRYGWNTSLWGHSLAGGPEPWALIIRASKYTDSLFRHEWGHAVWHDLTAAEYTRFHTLFRRRRGGFPTDYSRQANSDAYEAFAEGVRCYVEGDGPRWLRKEMATYLGSRPARIVRMLAWRVSGGGREVGEPCESGS